MRFIVLADSHIRFPDDDTATYPSNALMVDRNRRVVELCNRLDPEFVVHLGDIVHPLPVEDGHVPAVQLAADVYSQLNAPIHYVAGNHDIGDKPDALVAVPAVAEENYPVFEQYWGSPFGSFDHGGCHFVIVDTPALNSGLQREAAQRMWLDADLAAAREREQRIFVFTHYPPFVRDAAEDEHYDNLGEPARGWILATLARHEVEAVFSGHVHNFLYNHHEGTDLYVVPATGFVRPDYSELAAILPESEGGRDDPAKLGLFVVDVKDDGHTIVPVRTYGSVDVGAPTPPPVRAVCAPGWRSPVGVTLRHGWMSDVSFPTAGLDEFRRKTIRNDALLPALWEARISEVRIPVGDVAAGTARDRLNHLHGRGMNFTVRSAGVPDDPTIARVAAARPAIARWEIVVPPKDIPATLAALAEAPAGLPLAIAPLVPLGPPESTVHHFVTSGFDPSGSTSLDELLEADAAGLIGEIVFRIAPNQPIGPAVAAASNRARAAARGAIVNIELARAGESTPFDDDAAVADRVEEAARAALSFPDVAMFLDGFVDHDRSYYPRHGLIDRRSNPRPALHRLIAVASASAASGIESASARTI
jgi:predicted phosphodiesterase